MSLHAERFTRAIPYALGTSGGIVQSGLTLAVSALAQKVVSRNAMGAFFDPDVKPGD